MSIFDKCAAFTYVAELRAMGIYPYFTPTILSIESLRQDGGMWLFKVETQRGPAEFYVRNWRDSSHEISHLRFQIVSVDGQRFEIRDLNALDERSQALLDQLF